MMNSHIVCICESSILNIFPEMKTERKTIVNEYNTHVKVTGTDSARSFKRHLKLFLPGGRLWAGSLRHRRPVHVQRRRQVPHQVVAARGPQLHSVLLQVGRLGLRSPLLGGQFVWEITHLTLSPNNMISISLSINDMRYMRIILSIFTYVALFFSLLLYPLTLCFMLGHSSECNVIAWCHWLS